MLEFLVLAVVQGVVHMPDVDQEFGAILIDAGIHQSSAIGLGRRNDQGVYAAPGIQGAFYQACLVYLLVYHTMIYLYRSQW
jgi:hypothetical protein